MGLWKPVRVEHDQFSKPTYLPFDQKFQDGRKEQDIEMD